jgi:putative intracellular protease/amidase/YHS domain-containing protein
MNRRDLLHMSAALGLGGALTGKVMAAGEEGARVASADSIQPLRPPADGIRIPVAVLISEGAVPIDFVGPWEVFDGVTVHGHNPFELYTVAETMAPVRADGGMNIMPNYTFDTAPAPKVIVIPAQKSRTEAILGWIRKSSQAADLTMSVCTGAFLLAKTGLLDGKEATTHHDAYKEFAMAFPSVRLKRGARYVDLGNIASAGGLSSGMDLALHVVQRYYGKDVATATAYYLEYQGQGWLDPNSNNVYAKQSVSTDEHPLCPVCSMAVDKATAPRSAYQGKTYYFCMQEHKALFEANPQPYLES